MIGSRTVALGAVLSFAKVLEKVHEKYVNEALFLMVTHDVNPRAMSPKVKGFVQAKNRFQNFSSITMAP